MCSSACKTILWCWYMNILTARGASQVDWPNSSHGHRSFLPIYNSFCEQLSLSLSLCIGAWEYNFTILFHLFPKKNCFPLTIAGEENNKNISLSSYIQKEEWSIICLCGGWRSCSIYFLYMNLSLRAVCAVRVMLLYACVLKSFV